MRNIAVAEKFHEKRYLALLKMVKEGTMFKREQETVWRCRNCGCLVRGKEAPKSAPPAIILRPTSRNSTTLSNPVF